MRADGLDIFDETQHAAVVGSLPVDTLAVRTHPELVVVARRPRRKPGLDVGLGNLLESTVAAQTATKRFHPAEEIEPPKDLNGLSTRFRGAHKVPMRHGAALKDAYIARQQNSAFGHRDINKLAVGEVVAIIAIEPELPREGAEVGVENEPRFPKRLRTDAHHP